MNGVFLTQVITDHCANKVWKKKLNGSSNLDRREKRNKQVVIHKGQRVALSRIDGLLFPQYLVVFFIKADAFINQFTKNLPSKTHSHNWEIAQKVAIFFHL